MSASRSVLSRSFNLLLRRERRCCCFRLYSTKLYEVGKLEEPKHETESYSAGQMFLHKVFPYRGMILHPWLARVYDRDIVHTEENKSTGDQTHTKGIRKRSHLYYQVLVDERDWAHVKAESLSVTFLPSDYIHRNSLFLQPYAIPGIDYVAHEDILPYTSTEKARPVHHEWFDKFFTVETDPDKGPKYVPKEGLTKFQERNHPWLCLSDVYKETTENIRVTVIPFYIGKQESYNKYWWRYCVRLENLGEETVQLRERHWKVFSKSNSFESMQGRGVIGKEPKLTKASPAFQYNSHVSLESPTGYMWGLFTMERSADESTFTCKIPAFNLDRAEDRMGQNPSGDDTLV